MVKFHLEMNNDKTIRPWIMCVTFALYGLWDGKSNIYNKEERSKKHYKDLIYKKQVKKTLML